MDCEHLYDVGTYSVYRVGGVEVRVPRGTLVQPLRVETEGPGVLYIPASLLMPDRLLMPIPASLDPALLGEVVIVEDRGVVRPFPRLRHWLRTGVRCTHPYWETGDGGRRDGWRMIDMGRRQMRRCAVCEWVEFR